MSDSARPSQPDPVAIVGVSMVPGDRAGRRACALGEGPSALAAETALAVALAQDVLGDGGYATAGPGRQRTGVILGRCDFYRTWSRRGTAGTESSASEGAGPSASLPMLLHPVRSQSPASPSTRVAEALGLGGPSCTIDADETAPLVALDAAVQDLHEHRADFMLVGSVQVLAEDEKGPAAPPEPGRGAVGEDEGSCGEAGGFLLLERLDDARRRGHRIFAVILATGRVVNPSLSGTTLRKKRLKALQALAESGGVDMRSVDLVEVHGTGIMSEDADWWEALRVALGDRGEARGSFRCVEPPAGHSSPIAALAGMMRLIASLHQRALPPSGGGMVPLPARIFPDPFGWGGEPREWPKPSGDSPRRALLIGQGCASTVQVIFEEAPQASAGRAVEGESGNEGESPREEVRPPSTSPPQGVGSPDARTMILCGHLALMNEFLSSQAAVFARLAACPRSSLPGPGSLSTPNGPPSEGPRWPLLEPDRS